MIGVDILCISRSVFFTLFIVIGTAPQAMTGDGLEEICRDDRAFVQGECWGFIHGVLSAMVAMESHGRVSFSACLPDELGFTEGKRVVLEFLDRKPAIRHIDAPTLVMRAVTESFPCEQ